MEVVSLELFASLIEQKHTDDFPYDKHCGWIHR